MKHASAAVLAVLVLTVAGCGGGGDNYPDEAEQSAQVEEPTAEPEPEPEPEVDLAPLEDELQATLEFGGDGLDLYVTGIEAGGGNRVRVLTQLNESQTEEADAICNLTTVAAYGLDGIEVSGVDVAAAGGRNIAHCVPKV